MMSLSDLDILAAREGRRLEIMKEGMSMNCFSSKL